MYETFGAVVTQKRVEFKLFFPDKAVDPTQYERGGLPRIKEIRIRGDFQSKIGGENWDFDSAPVMTKGPHPKGWLYTYKIAQNLPDGYYQYKYFVTFENETTRWCTDPCTKYGGGEEENSAFVIGGHTMKVKALTNRLPPKDLVMYELMIDDFTKEFRGNRAPVDAVQDKLDYLQSLGVNAIAFMPWTAWPGEDFRWGYCPFQFFSVEHRYVHDKSDPCDKLYRLKSLISELHKRDMHVVMDGVFNHVNAGINPNHGFPYLWMYQNPEESPYIGKYGKEGFFEELDYDNQCTQEFIRDVCVYWLDVYEIDGIRFDYSLGFYLEGDLDHGIAKLISDVKEYLSGKNKKNVSLIIEHLTDDRYAAINDTNEICATACWFDPFMYKSFDYTRNCNVDMDILRVLNANLDFNTGKGPVTYIENHDHSTIVSIAGGRDRWYKTQPSAIALLTAPGTVMIHNGQEFGEDYFLPESGPDRVQSRPLRWEDHCTDFVGQRLYAIYRKLIEMRMAYPSLRSPNFFPFPFNHEDGYGAFPDRGIVVYHRYGSAGDGEFERFIILINYSDFDQYVDIPFGANGLWEDLLNGGNVMVENYRLYGQRISSNWGRIYYRKG